MENLLSEPTTTSQCQGGCTYLTVVVHPHGPGPIVLNLNLGQAGSAISVGHDAAVHITPDSTCHRPASLVKPQIPAVTGAGVNGGEEDDSATESETESDQEEMCRKMSGKAQQQIPVATSVNGGEGDDSATELETESDREEMMKRIHMRLQQTAKTGKDLHSDEHVSPLHACCDSTPAPDSQPDDLLPTTSKSRAKFTQSCFSNENASRKCKASSKSPSVPLRTVRELRNV
ncbi:hypothetical protein PILCRDRAFT_16490 [Piloderma croceum F 1598]|uniref:Uncharacterized protein n=1 Tax=Piloderma croceum (strain F 1598) TaxID=765440 RepID=A0A0C3EW59_PILCF|nr:hypothetical protein PILCRDRAFT_16490 [Piloderma croceum F 1598]